MAAVENGQAAQLAKDCHQLFRKAPPDPGAGRTTMATFPNTGQSPAGAAGAIPSPALEIPRRGAQRAAAGPSPVAGRMSASPHIGESPLHDGGISASPIMSFSPSKMSVGTLSRFSSEDNSGVPLQTSWTFWIDKPIHNATMAEYKESLKKIYTVSTVQGFWSVYNHIPDASELRMRTYYHLMRDEREPLWEDPTLASGGVWRIKCAKRDTPRVWKELMLAAIGEQFSDFLWEDDDVCGLSISPREKDDLVQIWNMRSSAAEKSRVLEKVHLLVPDVRFNAEFYKPHQTHTAFEGARN